MPTDIDVLSQLRQRLDPEAFSQTVNRWIRVPEIVERLQDPAVFEALISNASSPGDIGQAIIGGLPGQAQGPNLDALPADLRTRVEAWMVPNPLPSTVQPETDSLGLRALALLQLDAEPDGSTAIAQRTLAEPQVWLAPLICVWTWLSEPGSVTQALLAGGDRRGLRLAAAALLSQTHPDVAAATLASAFPGSPHSLFQHLRALGEDALAESLARDWLNRHPTASSEGIEHLVTEASAQERVNGPAAAMSVLEHAWEQTACFRAEIADRLAELAERSGDLVLAAEARQKAQAEVPSVDRRAHAALALIESGKIDEGLGLVPQSTAEPMDLAVIGLAYLADNRPGEAETYLTRAAEAMAAGALPGPEWLGRTTHALLALGNPSHAASVAQLWVDTAPGNLDARTSLAAALHRAGDEDSAAAQAGWLLAMDPTQDAARQVLAESLQAVGRPGDALEHWQSLALTNAKALKPLIECALEADDLPVAKHQASRWLALDPESPQALVMYGRTLTAAGELDAARDHLQLATERSPQSPETWLALVEAQRAMGDSALAGETLSRAIQICPEDPGLSKSMAEHLTQQGRLSEALEHLVRAQRLAPDDPQLQLSHGILLLELGHVEQAVPELQAAHDRRPSHLPALTALAKAYEHIGDILEAAELVKDIPDGAPRDSLLLAGRVATRAAAKSNNSSMAELGLHRLQLAEVKAEHDPDAAYWLAEALRLASRGEEAMAAYQACLTAAKAGPSDLKLRASLGLAQAAIDVGQTAVGISVLENLRAEGNPSAAGLVLLSKAYRKAGLADEALSPALEAVQIDPEYSGARTEAVEVAIQAKAWDTALEQISHWVKSAPEEPEAWTQKARVHALNSDSAGARSALARALEIGSSQPHVILSIGRTLAKLGDQTQAVRILRRASHTLPANQELLRSLAEQAERAGSHAVAYEAYTRLSEFEPGDAHLLRQVGESLWKLNRRSEAIGFWQRAQAAHPKNASLTVRLARAHIENAEPDRGLEQFRQAVKLTPDDPQLAVEAAAALTSHGAASEALALLGTTASLVPDNTALKLALVDAYSLNGDHQQAVNVLEEVSSSLSEPGLAVQARLSLALSRLGRHDEAQSAYSAVRGRELATADDAVLAARAALRQGDWPGVQSAVDAGLSDEHATPEHVEILVESTARLLDAGWLYRQSGDVRRHAPAGQTLTEAEERAPWLERARAAAVPAEKIARLQAHLALAGGTMQAEEAVDAYESPACLDSLAIAYLRQGNPDQVIAVLSKNAGARVSDYGPILAGLAHSQSGRFVQARKAYGAAQPLPAIRPLAVYLTGQAWAAEGKIQEAVNAYNAALAAWPDEAGWHSTLARAYTSIGELDGALPHLQQAVDLEPSNAEFRLSLAKHLQAIGSHDEAEKEFSQILPHYVDQTDVWLQAGYASLAVGQIDAAAHRFEHASKLDPGSPAPHIGSARAAHAVGNTGRAVQHAAQAVELAPEDPEALVAWADMLGSQGKIDKALTVYERAGSLMVDPSAASLARSQLFLKSGRPEAAVLELKKVVESRPDDDHVWSAMARAHEAVGDLDQASAAVRKALELAPATAHRMDLARLSRKAGQLDHALAELSALQMDHPDDADVAYELGRVHESRRDLERALDAFRRAIVLDNRHAPAHFHAGLVLKTLKAYDESADMFRRAVDLNPKDPDAHHQLAAVRALELVHGGLRQSSAVAS